jgi:RHS repeat-associated protein
MNRDRQLHPPDFYPFGGERVVTNTCSQNYKFEGEERDTETNNDDFGARYYSSQYGRWLSADWSSVPAPVPYANLTNPQTLNLYAMVSDNPESFADLDGHSYNPAFNVFTEFTGCGVELKECPDQQPTSQNTGAAGSITTSTQQHPNTINVEFTGNTNSAASDVHVESGVAMNFSLTTSDVLAPGPATLVLSLQDSKGHDSTLGKDTDLGPEVNGDIKTEEMALKKADGSTNEVSRGTQMNVRVTPISPDNDFGRAGKPPGFASLVFTITDSHGTKFSGSIAATVAKRIDARKEDETTGHSREHLPALNRVRFNVPQ